MTPPPFGADQTYEDHIAGVVQNLYSRHLRGEETKMPLLCPLLEGKEMTSL